MNLQEFKSKLNNKNVVEVSNMETIKGGLRYESANFSQFSKKLSSLYSEGEQCRTGYHNGVYCIEW